MTRDEIKYSVSLTLREFADEYDIDGIADDIVSRYGRVHIDTIPSSEYWDLVGKRG